MGRIDVHQHLLPEPYVQWLRSEGIGQAGGRELPAWSADGAIATMDDHSISTGMLSLSTPGTHLGDDARALDKARQINDIGAELVKDRPDRFGYFATIPLPYVDGAVQESIRALDELGADGVVLLANSRGTYLGDPAFEPLMTELDRRSAVVFVHPAELPAPAVRRRLPARHHPRRREPGPARHPPPPPQPEDHPFPCWRFPAVRRPPHRRQLHRPGTRPRQGLRRPHVLLLRHRPVRQPPALPSLLAFARPGHVRYGSDWPFAPDLAVKYFTDGLDAHDPDDTELHRAIDSANALHLFPRLA